MLKCDQRLFTIVCASSSTYILICLVGAWIWCRCSVYITKASHNGYNSIKPVLTNAYRTSKTETVTAAKGDASL